MLEGDDDFLIQDGSQLIVQKITEDDIKHLTKTEDVAELLLDKAQKLYDDRKAEFGEDLIKEISYNEYKDLLKNKWHFVILDVNGVLNVLTKEKGIIGIMCNNAKSIKNHFTPYYI